MKKFIPVLLALGLFLLAAAPVSLNIGHLNIAVTQKTFAANCTLGDIGCLINNKFGDELTGIVDRVVTGGETAVVARIDGTGKATASTNTGSKNLSDYYEQYGALGAMGLGMKQMYDTPPIKPVDYLATIHPITPAFAVSQCTVVGNPPTNTCGIFTDTIILFWTAARNLAYILFVIVLVAIGLMMLFRSKLDPRTTVTVTAAIPGVIAALILITFSLAIAGFMINIGQALQEVVKNILLNPVLTAQPLLNQPGVLTTPSPDNQVGLSVTDIWARFLTPFKGNGYVSLGSGLGSGVVSFFVTFVVAIFTFIVAIQVFFMLFMRYLNLIVKPIYAPIAFLFGAIPGRGGVTVNWFKGYIIDILVFPLTLLLLNMAMAIRISGEIGKNGDPFGIIAGGAGVDLTSLVVIGILIITTKVPGMLEAAFDVKPDAHVSRSGVDPSSMAKKVPLIGNFFK